MSIVILDNFDSFTYNLYQMVQAQTELPVRVFRNNALSWEDLLALQPDRVILSPGPGHPSRPADFGLCRDVLQRHEALGCPVLGVCLGHQGMAHYFGGQVVPAPAIVHGKTSPVSIVRPSPLLEGLPNPFTVMRYHSWTVDRDSFPAEFEVIAELAVETAPKSVPNAPMAALEKIAPHENHATEPLVMAMQHRYKPLYGVQFHPESVGTQEGARLLGNFLRIPARSPAVNSL